MRRYRLEVFGRDLNFKTFAETSEPSIALDKLVQTESEVECFGIIQCDRGDYGQIRVDGNVYYQGIISDLEYDGNKTTVTLQQLDSLLDNEVFADVSLLSNQTIETWMSNLLTSYFNGADTYQNLTGFTVTSDSSTQGSYTTSDDGSYNMYDLMNHFFKVYGVILSISFDVSAKTITFAFSAVDTANVTKLNVRVTDVQSFAIENSITDDHCNKMTVRDMNSSDSLTYYWHPTQFGGSVDTDANTNRETPVKTQCIAIVLEEGQTFADASYTFAYQAMYNSRYDDLITVSFKADSKLMPIGTLGDLYELMDGENTYLTMLTGIRVLNMRYAEMTFGYVRKRLTQIIKMDRRK